MGSFRGMVGDIQKCFWVTLRLSRQLWPTREADPAHRRTQAVAFSMLSTVASASLLSLLVPDHSLGDVCPHKDPNSV